MKNLKKIMSLLVVLAFAFSCFAVYAEDGTNITSDVEATTTFSDITSGTVLGEAVTELVAYNIISGYPDGTFKPDGAITRAEFATVIARFRGIASNLAADAVTGFADLDSDSSRAWCRPYVKAAYDAGIISGFEDGTFRAGEPVTYEQAVKMVVCAINYDVIALSEHNKLMATNPESVTWSSGYIAAANKNGITKNAIVGDIRQNATRGLVAILTCNALNAPKINTVTDSNGNVSYEVSNETNKEDVADTKEKIEGVVSGTYYTSLTSQNPDLQVNEIEILKTDGTTATYELSEKLLSTVDLEDLLGKRVTAYYSKSDGQIVSCTEKNTTITKITESQIVRPLSGSTIKYLDSSERNQSVSVSGYTFIYNGKYMDSMNLDTLDSEFSNGYIEVVETSNSKLVKVKSYTVGVVSSFDKTKEKIFFKYGKGEYQFPSRTADKPTIYVGSTKTEFSSLSLSAYDVVNIYESPATAEGAALKKMYVTKGAKTGKVTATTDTHRKVEINSTDYYLTNDYYNYTPSTGDEEKAPFDLGESYTYYLDCTGQIAAVKYTAATAGTYKYGYVVVIGENDNGSQAVRLITDTGSDTVYTLKSSVKVDGVKIKDTQVASKLEASATVANSGYESVVGEWSGTASGTKYSQLIKYSLSGSYIDSIDTVLTDEGGTGDNLSYDITVSDGKSTNTSATQLKQGSKTFAVDSVTKLLYVPDNRTDYSSYSVMKNTAAFAIANKSYYIEAFGIDATTKKAAFVLVYGFNPSLQYRSNSPYMIVSKKFVDVEGDQTCFEGYVGTSTSLSTVKVSEEGYKDISSIETMAAPSADLVDKGDVIRFIKDSKGEIVSLMIWYDASSPVQEGDASSESDAKNDLKRLLSVSDSLTSLALRYGMPLQVDADAKTLRQSIFVESDSADDDAKSDLANAKDYNCSSAKIFELTSSGVNVVESLDSVYDVNSGSPSTVLVMSGAGVDSPAKWIYIINK